MPSLYEISHKMRSVCHFLSVLVCAVFVNGVETETRYMLPLSRCFLYIIKFKHMEKVEHFVIARLFLTVFVRCNKSRAHVYMKLSKIQF